MFIENFLFEFRIVSCFDDTSITFFDKIEKSIHYYHFLIDRALVHFYALMKAFIGEKDESEFMCRMLEVLVQCDLFIGGSLVVGASVIICERLL